MKIPTARYWSEDADLKVFSYIVEVPFAPLDIDLPELVHIFGWDSKVDRFRIWDIPKISGMTNRNCSYILVKKLDRQQDVILLARIEFSPYGEWARSRMAISMLCNDDEYPDRFLSLFVDKPPSFHGPEEFMVVEKAWVDYEDDLHSLKSCLVEPAVTEGVLQKISVRRIWRPLAYDAANRCYYGLMKPKRKRA